jgi:hypothetical protein
MKFWLKVFGFILLGLILLLIPLFAVYVATAQALPNEGRYLVKQYSEKVIDNLTGIYPDIYANFSLLKSQRRYQEVIGLVDQDQSITEVNQRFIDQVRQTLFDIQSVGDSSLRLTYTAQYQTFLKTANENLSYRVINLEDQLKTDQDTPTKIFQVDEFEVVEGKLVAKKRAIEQTSVIKQRSPVSKELLTSNIEQLELAQITLNNLIQK